jgi:hypothetical protein
MAVAGTTPYRVDYPGSYFHKPHTAFSARLEHAFTVRISKEGYLAQQVTLTNGPFEWIAVTGRHRGNYFLLKADHFEIKLEAISIRQCWPQCSKPKHTDGKARCVRLPSPRKRFAQPSRKATPRAGASPSRPNRLTPTFTSTGNSWARLRRPSISRPASHHVEVRVQGRQTWERELEVLKDSQLTLHAVFSD